MKEIWKDVVGYEGIYKVSNAGKIKSLKFNKEKILKKTINNNGYSRVCFSLGGITKSKQVHQLVAIAFLGHKPDGMNFVIDHINDNKLDNRVDNLQIVTTRFNVFKTQGKYSSQYKGVCWSNDNKKWIASIYINGKIKYLGYFIDEHEAHLAYQNALKNIEL